MPTATQQQLFDPGPPIPDEPNYLYSVIYSFDIPSDQSVARWRPPERRKLWQMTEGDDQHNYLCECPEDQSCDCGWRRSKHREYCGILTQEQFDAFVEDLCLHAEDVETMGSLGAPGFGYGCAPAISFNYDASEGIANAYVTPCPLEGDEFWSTEEAWKKVRRQVIEQYK
jgi:hypothetical protein